MAKKKQRLDFQTLYLDLDIRDVLKIKRETEIYNALYKNKLFKDIYS